jgi:hypothetical protein
MKKQFLIITGPQGSGNHLFSKIFALDEQVYGWQDLLDEYWIYHFYEPFAEHWNNPELLKTFDWSKRDYYVSSISCPYAKKGNPIIPAIPDYKKFIEQLENLDIEVKVAVIGRDRNILESQQTRVRNRFSLPDFEKELEYLDSKTSMYLSTELLYLYKNKYIKNIGQLLNFPVNHTDIRINEILKEDSNKKYIQNVELQELDKHIRAIAFNSNI